MSYYFEKTLDSNLEECEERVREKLKEQGFGVLTEIDVSKTLKEKIDVDFPKYKILGACNPHFAHKALQSEPGIGVMLPCSVVIRETAEKKSQVLIIDPIASMQAVQNEGLHPIAGEVQAKLKSVAESL
jgi:uncharacterized protein (DUF302 family)